jgi:hypothetical protein
MEMILSNDFCEINQKECWDINGGSVEPLEVVEFVGGAVLTANSIAIGAGVGIATGNPAAGFSAGAGAMGLGLQMMGEAYDEFKR